MNYYLISGTESLLTAACAELQARSPKPQEEPTGNAPFDGIVLHGKFGAFWFTDQAKTGAARKAPFEYLTLPADWDKLMGVLEGLKKPKVPEYVRAGTKGVHYKIAEWQTDQPSAEAYDIYGKRCKIFTVDNCNPITEQEFIDGGLKELAEAGYVKGATGEWIGSDNTTCRFTVQTVYYTAEKERGAQEVQKEVDSKGFAFVVGCNGMQGIVGRTAIIAPELPTTSQGIPYKIDQGEVYFGEDTGESQINTQILRYLLKQGVYTIYTKAGRLLREDLELLTK